MHAPALHRCHCTCKPCEETLHGVHAHAFWRRAVASVGQPWHAHTAPPLLRAHGLQISHGNTARHALEHGDDVLAKICGLIASDEGRHELAYCRCARRVGFVMCRAHRGLGGWWCEWGWRCECVGLAVLQGTG